MHFRTFNLTDVRLSDGFCRKAQVKNLAYMLNLDPDSLLYSFRANAGLPAPGQPLGGWEAPNVEVRGQFIGHYLTACALMYANTGNQETLDRGKWVVAELATCQEALGREYLSAFPESFWDRLESQEKVWAPFYVIHKIMAGLYDQYALCGNAQALQVLKNMVAYFEKRLRKFTHAQWNAITDKTEEGGICETLWDLYHVTNDPAHKAFAEKFEKTSFLDSLARGADNLTGRHANTHIPLVVAAMRRYEITGEARYLYLAQFFWDRVVTARTFATGGSTIAEIWGEPFKLAGTLGFNNHETCKTYNMLRLTRHLLCCAPEPRYADYYERAWLNGIWGTQGPTGGNLEYYMPQGTGFQRVFGLPLDSFWCCYGSGIETWSKVCDSIYYHNDDTLFVNLFVPSRLDWKAKGVSVVQTTDFPEETGTTLTLEMRHPARFTLQLRVPYWVAPGYAVRLNGVPLDIATTPSSFVRIDREWRSNDCVAIVTPMALHASPLPDDPNLVAIMYGPMVLAGITDASTTNVPFLSQNNIPKEFMDRQPQKACCFLADSVTDLSWLKPVPGAVMQFQATGQPCPILFKPFYQVVGEHYGLYWPIVPKGSDRDT